MSDEVVVPDYQFSVTLKKGLIEMGKFFGYVILAGIIAAAQDPHLRDVLLNVGVDAKTAILITGVLGAAARMLGNYRKNKDNVLVVEDVTPPQHD